MSLKTNFELVCDFNNTFDFSIFPVESAPLETQQSIVKYRCDLIKEEGVEEFGDALKQNSRVDMLDAVVDHLYVLYGACHTFGMNPDFHISKMQNNANPTELYFKQFDKNVSIQTLYKQNIVLYNNLVHEMQISKNILNSYSILLHLITNTYYIGFHLTSTVKKLNAAFRNVHSSNMSKLCTSISEANDTVNTYLEKFKNNASPYDSPYYYEIKPSVYVVKNKSTGKALKSINYTPADLEQFLNKA
jgi:predicted HAD superfamily Cof-like phosphohydrolase